MLSSNTQRLVSLFFITLNTTLLSLLHTPTRASESKKGKISLVLKKEKTMASSSRAVSASLLFFFLLLGFSAAKELLVGGKIDAWKIPSSEVDSLNQWAEKSRFRVGDYLVWKFESGKDSVLEVTREEYGNCSSSNPIKEYSDGNTKVMLERPGPFYFISGAKGHCEKGQKLVVVVISPKHTFRAISPAPSPAEFEAPAVAPTSTATTLQVALLTSTLLVFAMTLVVTFF
ncbi:hypothetical protein V8G54_006986 [Vigna mungo]|uniref:Phytocyanin domain-containing protein n=1 Tax=Vigna mungo TaxID=3915 RepID=A0AAQ3P0V8_VIGMU